MTGMAIGIGVGPGSVDSTSSCMCRYEMVPAIKASSPTQPMVVLPIHRSARPLAKTSECVTRH
jgi:hypothetical protein